MSDLISRQDAIAYFFRPYSNEEVYSNVDIEKALNALPSAEETGKWVEQDNGYFFCSKCGKYPENQVLKTDFCPNCGTKMEDENG